MGSFEKQDFKIVCKNFSFLKVLINLGVYYSFQDFPMKIYLGIGSWLVAIFWWAILIAKAV